MVITIKKLYQIIDNLLNNSYTPGSIKECLENNNCFHLSFDDGFKEHLNVAYLLKKRYNLNSSTLSFSINTSNSISHNFSGMDLIYNILENYKVKKLNNLLKKDFDLKNIPEIKKSILLLKPEQLKQLSEFFPELHNQLKKTFLNNSEIYELSKMFQISSHGVTHRDLTNHKEESEKEILESKAILEHIINKKIDTFCYPEGKNNKTIQKFCNDSGYKYALSIRHEHNNNFCIGRKIL
jgi:hypothetical protein